MTFPDAVRSLPVSRLVLGYPWHRRICGGVFVRSGTPHTRLSGSKGPELSTIEPSFWDTIPYGQNYSVRYSGYKYHYMLVLSLYRVMVPLPSHKVSSIHLLEIYHIIQIASNHIPVYANLCHTIQILPGKLTNIPWKSMVARWDISCWKFVSF